MARLHRLGPEGFADAAAFVSELTAESFAVVALPPAASVALALHGAPTAVEGFQWSSKVQGSLKARTQLRRLGRPATREPLAEAFEVMEAVAVRALEAWCHAQGLPVELARRSFGDLSFAPEEPLLKGEKGKSVLNLCLGDIRRASKRGRTT